MTALLGDSVWDGLLSRGRIILEREIPSGRLFISFDCMNCADLEARAFFYLDDGQSGCLRCDATPTAILLDPPRPSGR